ncbi:MAG: winged helix-turn-helix domain-containing protein, partial [Arcobacteraceae bacterium]
AKRVNNGEKEIVLTQKEYELLLFLVKNKNKSISNTLIEEQLWNNEEYINSNVIQVTIYNLRKKLGKDFIKSSRGFGYKIEV